MKRFAAVVLDSFHEAWSSRIFQILLGLVAAVLFLLLSMGFESPDYQKGLQGILDGLGLDAKVVSMTAEARGARDVAIRGRVALDDPKKYVEGIGRLQARRLCEQKKIYSHTVEAIAKGEGDGFGVEFKVIDTFWENKVKEKFTIDRSNVDAILVERLAEELKHRQIEGARVRIAASESWRRELEISGTTSHFRLADRCRVSFLFGAFSSEFERVGVAQVAYLIESVLFDNLAGFFGLILAVIACAAFVPTMLQKGSIELWLSRPVGRAGLYTLKYLGAFAFILPLALLLFVGSFLILSIKTGYWNFSYLVVILSLSVNFAVLQAVSGFFGLLWKSQIVSILMSMGVWFGSYMLFLMHSARSMIGKALPEWAVRALDFAHFASPRMSELGLKCREIMREGAGISADPLEQSLPIALAPLGEMILVSLGFVLLVHVFSCWLFSRRDP
jgi:ABC-type transport system involved in multi-copper enzyme maturation permease subunit